MNPCDEIPRLSTLTDENDRRFEILKTKLEARESILKQMQNTENGRESLEENLKKLCQISEEIGEAKVEILTSTRCAIESINQAQKTFISEFVNKLENQQKSAMNGTALEMSEFGTEIESFRRFVEHHSDTRCIIGVMATKFGNHTLQD